MKRIVSFAFVFVWILSFTSFAAETVQEATVKVAEDVGKSVVSISSVVKKKVSGRYFGTPFEDFGGNFDQFFKEFFGEIPQRELKRVGLGSGVIIDEEGYILTNQHVIAGASEIKVKLSDGREFNAEVKGTDERNDLAVIKIKAKKLPVARLGDSDALKIAEWVLAIGNPFGFAIDNPEPTVTVGVISALHRFLPSLGRREKSFDDLIQTDAAINPGNSGGPLVNLKGEVIGINTAIITTSGGYQGLGFALPINKVKTILKKLISGEKILYGWLGVSIQDLNDDLRNYFGIKERRGVIVVKLFKNSPAEKAGVKEGDLILLFNSRPIKATRDLIRLVSAAEVGAEVPMIIVRNGKQQTVQVKIGKRPEDEDEASETEPELAGSFSFRGLTAADITPELKRRYRLQEDTGIVITEIEEGSFAEKAGLREGDLIMSIESRKVSSVEEFKKIASELKGRCLIKTDRGYSVLRENN